MPTRLHGAIALRKALLKFEPELAKATTKEMGAFLKPVTKNARGYIPSNEEALSGWLRRPNAKGRWANRFFDSATVKSGISYKTTPSKANRQGFRALASIFNKSAAGAIYETAGRKSGNVGNFSPRLGGQLKGDKQKMTGRAIFRAFEEDQGKATAGVIKAIEASAAKFNARTKL
jgi:hypothetical protein